MTKTENGLILASRRDVMKFVLSTAGAAVLGREAIEAARAEEAASTIKEVYRSQGAKEDPNLMYPKLKPVDPSREEIFPDVPKGDRPALAGYEASSEDSDFLQTGKGDMDIDANGWRYIGSGHIVIPQLNVELNASVDEHGRRIGTFFVGINHFGDTAMYRDIESDSGFTVKGENWDLAKAGQVTELAQAFGDHFTFRNMGSSDGANCGQRAACQGGVDFAIAVIGNGEPQAIWTGSYRAPVEAA